MIAIKDNCGNVSVLMPMEILCLEDFDLNQTVLPNYSGDPSAVSLMATDAPAVAEEETTAAAPDAVATDAPAVADDEIAPRPSLFIRAALWIHRYAAAIVAAIIPLFVLYVITKTESPATAAAPAALVAATVATDTPAPVTPADAATDAPAVVEDTTAAAPAAVATDTPAAVATVPGDSVAGQNIANAEDHAPALSPDDLADIYAAYLAAASSPDCGPVLSSPATTTAATAAPAVDVATVPGDTAPGDTLPAPVLGL